MEPNSTVARAAAGAGRVASSPGAASTEPSREPFDPAKLEKSSVWGVLFINWALSYPVHRWWMGFLRFFTPVFRVPGFFRPIFRTPGWAIVLRYDAVCEVLSHDKDFPVPWGWKMEQVTGGKDAGGRNFVLGMPRDEVYRLSYTQLAEAFPLADVPRVRQLAKDASKPIVRDKSGGDRPGFDGIESLVTAVPTRLCEDYYGISIEDKVLFAKWTLAISSYLFAPPFARPPAKQSDGAPLGLAAAACLREAIRASIAQAHQGKGKGIVLPRFIEMQKKDSRIDDDVIHAQLFGMVLGFIPTNVLAGGNILETLLLEPEFQTRACAAALAEDDDLLWRCLRETLRFRNINAGPFRTCPAGYHSGAIRVPAGAKVLASTQAAMFDPRRIEYPEVFNPYRRDEDYLMFSTGQHWCVGAYIAIAQITQTFKALLRRGAVQAVDGKLGHMQRFGVFPLHLRIRYAPKA